MGIILAISLLAAIGASAQEFSPYPDSKITVAQWQTYLDLVREKLGASKRTLAAQHLETYTDQATRTVYTFTQPGHPAHPAWITLRIVENNKNSSMEQAGFFAGDEPSFATMFTEYQQWNERIVANRHGAVTGPPPPKAAAGVIDEPAGQGTIARGLLDKFLSEYDQAGGDGGWSLLSPGFQQLTSLAQWQSDRAQFVISAGVAGHHDVEKITWYLNPPHSQGPGLYAAYDMSCHYFLLFYCGEVVILYSPKVGDPFVVMRHDNDVVTFESASGLCKNKAVAHVDFGNGRTFDILCSKLNEKNAAPGDKGPKP
jgi:hypothetical protein